MARYFRDKYGKKTNIVEKYEHGYIKKEVSAIHLDSSRPLRWQTYSPKREFNSIEHQRITKRIEGVQNSITAIREKGYKYATEYNNTLAKIKELTNDIRRATLNRESIGQTKYKLARHNISEILKQLSKKRLSEKARAVLQKNLEASERIVNTYRGYNAAVGVLTARRSMLQRELRSYRAYKPEVVERNIGKKTLQIRQLELLRDKISISDNLVNDNVALARKEYDRLNIRYFESQSDMFEYFLKYNPNYWNTHNIDDYWRQYRHRDMLIASGQYEEYLANKYKRNYIKTLDKLAGLGGNNSLVNNIVANLNRLTSSQLIDLFRARDSKVNTAASRLMPDIAFVYTIMGTISRPKQALEEMNLLRHIKDAFAQVGLQYDPELTIEGETPYDVIAKEKYTRHARRQIEFDDFVDTLRVRDILRSDYSRTSGTNTMNEIADKASITAYNLLSYTERVKYSPNEIDTVTKRAIIIQAMKKMGLKFSKVGKPYVPFFNSDLVAEYLSELS